MINILNNMAIQARTSWFLLKKPNHVDEIIIDNARPRDAYVMDIKTKSNNKKIEVYNDASVKVYVDGKVNSTMYLSNTGIANIRADLIGKEKVFEDAIRESKKLSLERKAHQVRK